MLTTTVCAALSAAGLAVAFLTAYRRRYTAATRIAAYALLPVGLAMAGLIGLGGKIGRAVGGWASDLVLKPTVWAGFGVLAVAVVLWVVSRAASRRSGRPSRKERRAAGAAPQQPAAPGASAPALGRSKPAQQDASSAPASKGDPDDFSDIEAILKKHGI
ncbi:hypothetical protein [Streptomyces sp. ODS28]|uniref:hypothetical protein n=1 Tax=Streptomyces sp. ODS28 TaxID=3136688 RepID=UPI0031E65F1E